MQEDYKGVDYFDIESLLTEEERMVRDSVRQFVSKEVLPIIEKHNGEGTFPVHLVRPMGELGLYGPSFEGYGCAGLSSVAYGLIQQELERGDSGLRSFCSVQSSLVMYPILTYGTEAQKERWLPRLASGEAIGCFGLTEPDHGSDPGGMETRLRRAGNGGWVLNGAKMWITNGSLADVAVVWARDDEGRTHGVLVEKGTPGYTTRDQKGKFSLRASVTSELIFQDCPIPDDALLPGAKGLKAPLSCLTQARYGIAWGAMGSAAACYTAAVEYAGTRTQFDRPIASFQLVQERLAWMLTEITKGQLVAWRLGRLKDEGKMRPEQVSLAKRNNVRVALEIAREARDILGANGITDEYPVGRHMCNLESVSTYEGTHNIHTLVLGRDITGISAFC